MPKIRRAYLILFIIGASFLIIVTSLAFLGSASSIFEVRAGVLGENTSESNGHGIMSNDSANYSMVNANSPSDLISEPKIAIEEERIYAVWVEDYYHSGKHEVFFKRSLDRGVTFSEPINLSASPSEDSFLPSIQVFKNFVKVTWYEEGAKENSSSAEAILFQKTSTDYGKTFGPVTRPLTTPSGNLAVADARRTLIDDVFSRAVHVKQSMMFLKSGGDINDSQLQANLRYDFSLPVNNNTNAKLAASNTHDISIQYFAYVNDGSTIGSQCSDMRVHVYLDGKAVDVSEWVGFEGRNPPLPLSTEIITFHHIDPSRLHIVTLIPESRVGGCNVGWINAWGGIITIFEPDSNAVFSHNKVIWYGARDRDQTDDGAFGRLLRMGLQPEYRNRPVSNLGDAKMVILDWPDWQGQYSAQEVEQLKNYVSEGGRLILAMDNDYYYCNPPSICAMELARNFGFSFAGNIKYDGTVVPVNASHTIWNEPNRISSFSNWCCDGYVSDILDPAHVKVLARVNGTVTSVTSYREWNVTNPIAIVVNENPAFNGGKVLGTGRDMFIGYDNTGASNFTMLDNIVSFMLQGKVADWTFEDTLADSSGWGNDGHFVGSTTTTIPSNSSTNSAHFVQGRIGKSLHFDGSEGEVITIRNTPILNFGSNKSFSISLWLRSMQRGEGDTGFGWLVDHRRNNDGIYAGYTIGDDSGKIVARIRDNLGVDVPVYSVTKVNDGNWHHIVLVVDRTNHLEKLYIDGNMESTSEISSIGNTDTDFNLNLGGTVSPNTPIDLYRGDLDQVRIYNKALALNEIPSA